MQKGIVFLLLVCIAMIMTAGCTSFGLNPAPVTTPTPQIVYVTVLVTPTPIVVTTTASPTQSQDEKMDFTFIRYTNDNQILDRMSDLFTSTSLSASAKEATELNRLIVTGPAPGSEKMKSYRNAMLNALAQLDGSSASLTRYLDAMPSVLDAADTALAQYSEKYSSSGASSSSLKLSGYGDDIKSFSVSNGGGFIVAGSNSGSSNFIVHITDSNGNIVEFLFNQIGPYSGKKIINLDAGKYYLEVQAEGAWSVTLTPS